MKESIVFTIMLKNNTNSVNDNTEKQKRTEFEYYLKNTMYFKKVEFIHKDTAFSNLKKDLGEDFDEDEVRRYLESLEPSKSVKKKILH